MIEYTTRYDVKKTMYEKFADSAAQHTNEPCFYYYNNTLTWAQAEKMVDLCSSSSYCHGSIRHDFLCSRKSRLKCKDRRTG